MKASAPWFIAGAVSICSMAAAFAYVRLAPRYELAPVGNAPIVARLDKRSGEVTLISAAGRVVGQVQPSDKFDADAYLAQKP